jgi:hypothetical protein
MTTIPEQMGMEPLGDHLRRISNFDNEDDPEVTAAQAEHKLAVASAWAAESGGDTHSNLAAGRVLMKRYNRSPDQTLVNFLLSDPGTHVIRYESESTCRKPLHKLGGQGFHLELDPWEHRGIWKRKCVVEINANTIKTNAGARSASPHQEPIKIVISPAVRPAIGTMDSTK